MINLFKIKGNNSIFLRQSFFPFNAFGMPSFNNSVWFSILFNRFFIFALQVVKMFGFVVVSFAVCWLPYHIYFLYTYHDKDIVRMAITKHVYLGIYWMAMINTSVNPFIYFMMNLKFRNYFIKAFLFLPRQEKNL